MSQTEPESPVILPNQEVYIYYKNWRGEEAWRFIKPISISFDSSEFHPEAQWLMHATDLNKDAQRTFALKDITIWQTEEPSFGFKNRNKVVTDKDCPICYHPLESIYKNSNFLMEVLDGNSCYQCSSNPKHKFWRNSLAFKSIHYNPVVSRISFNYKRKWTYNNETFNWVEEPETKIWQTEY